MIDQAARAKLMEDKKTKTLVEGIKEAVVMAAKSKEAPKEDKTEVLVRGMTDSVLAAIKGMAEQKMEPPQMVLRYEDQNKLSSSFLKLEDAIKQIYQQVTRPLPAVFKIRGDVSVTDIPSIRINNLKELQQYFKSLEEKIIVLAQASAMAPAPRIEMPKIEIPKMEIPKMPKQDTKKMESLLEEMVEKISSLNVSIPEFKFPKEINVGNFPVQMTPQPVTNININPLQGFAETTSVTVGTSPVRLPDYGQLFNRRSLVIYNNSANTIFIGGSEVTTSNGLPVAAGTFSPSIDAGYNMIIYGVASQGGNNVRVLEISKDQTSNVQQ